MHATLLKGYEKGQRIAQISAIILVIIGIMEVIVGMLTHSTAVTADGIDSFSDAVIASIIWFGLGLSLKQPTRYFHYGYLKVESLAAFGTSIGLVVIASFIIYRSYLSLLNPHSILFPSYALLALVVAGSISLYYGSRMRKVAKEQGLVSLQIGAANSIKDASGSFVVLGSVALASIGFFWMDAIGAIIVAGYIYTIAYVAIRESSLILLDSFNSPEVVEQIGSIVRSISGVKGVSEVKLRRSGPFLSGRVKIEVDPNMPVLEASKIAKNVETVLSEKVGTLREFVVILAPVSVKD